MVRCQLVEVTSSKMVALTGMLGLRVASML